MNPTPTRNLINSMAASLNLETPPISLCASNCENLADLSLRYISFLTYFGHVHENGQGSEKTMVQIANEWEELSGLAIPSRETIYKLRKFYFNVIEGKKRASDVCRFRGKCGVFLQGEAA